MNIILVREQILSTESTVGRKYIAETTIQFDQDMSTEWRKIVSRTVGSNRKLLIPPDIAEPLVNDEEDPHVFWNYQKNSQYLIISDTALSDTEYQPVALSKVMGYDNKNKLRIRPPKTLSDSFLSHFYEGSEMFYLQYEDMVNENDRTSVYLLTKKQVLELLPQNTDSTDSELKKEILNTPGILSSV